MRGSQRQNHASSSVLGPSSGTSSPSSIGAPSPARVTLPSDLSGSLKYLDDAQLNRLLEAVTERSIAEIKAVLRATPLRLQQPPHRHEAKLRPPAISRSRGLRRFRKEQQISFARRSRRE